MPHKARKERKRVGTNTTIHPLPSPPVGNNTFIYIVPPTDLEATAPSPLHDLYGVNFLYTAPDGDDSSRPSALFVWTSSRPLRRYTRWYTQPWLFAVMCGIPNGWVRGGWGEQNIGSRPVCFVFELDLALFLKRDHIVESENID